MTTNDVIRLLHALPAEANVVSAYGAPHSYRGYYQDLAVSALMERQTVGELLAILVEATTDTTFEGYKGGEYVMDGTEDLYVAYYGSTGRKVVGIADEGEGYYLVTVEDY